MANDNLLFKIDALVVDGTPVPIEEGGCTISGAARFEADVVPSASGDDFERRKRVPTTLDAKIQFGPAFDVASFTALSQIQITARDTQSGRRALMPKCSFAKLGSLGGGGSVDISFNVLAPIQWI